MRPWSRWLPVVALTVLGAALRFPTLDRQSFWLDELVTVSLLDRGLGDVLREIPRTEATPFVYYAVAWVWGSLFGLGEVGPPLAVRARGHGDGPRGLRCGSRARVAPRRPRRRRTGGDQPVPRLVFAGGAFLRPVCASRRRVRARLRARAPRRADGARGLGGRLRARDRNALLRRLPRRGGGPVAAPASPAAAARRRRISYFRRPCSSPTSRSCSPSAATPRRSPARPSSSGSPGSRRTSRSGTASRPRRSGARSPRCSSSSEPLSSPAWPTRERRGALVAGSLALAVIVTPVVLALAGADYVIARNAIAAVVPAAVCIGAGYAAGRLGLAAAAVLCVLSAAVALAPALDTAYGRTDWRGAAEPLETPGFARAIVVTPFMSRTLWRPYLPDLREPEGGRRAGRGDRGPRPGDRGRLLGRPRRAADRQRPEGSEGLPGRRRRAQADVHARPLPSRPTHVRPDVDADASSR